MTPLLYIPGTFSPTKSTSSSNKLVFKNMPPFKSRLSLFSLCYNSPIMTTLLYMPGTFSPTKSTSSSPRLVFRNITPSIIGTP